MTTAATTAPTLRNAEREGNKSESQGAIVFRRFLRHRMAVFSAIFIVLVFVASLLAPWITTFPRDQQDIAAVRPSPPGVIGSTGERHILGIDHLGRDLFTRVLYGGRISLSIALAVTLLSEVIGVVVGATAGYFGGWIDAVISRFTEFMLSIPQLPILLIVSALMIRLDAQLPLPDFVVKGAAAVFLSSEREAQKILVLVAILVIFGWLTSSRLMRGAALSLSKQDFVESLRALGASDARIIFFHIIPNGLAPIIVDASLTLGGVIITEAALSFLALGVQDPVPTWGNMLDLSRSYMFKNPWLPLIPGIPLVLVSLAFNFIGDGLRDALDPRLKR